MLRCQKDKNGQETTEKPQKNGKELCLKDLLNKENKEFQKLVEY